MNLNPTRSIVALLLVCAAGMFAVIAAFSNEPPVENPTPLTAVTSAAARDDIYTQPGQLVTVNGFRLNLYCMGSGSPTVVFDSGWETGRQHGQRCSHRSQSGHARAAMTVPGQDSAIPVQCRVPACASPGSYAPHCIVPASPGPIFWWGAPSAATTYAALRIGTRIARGVMGAGVEREGVADHANEARDV
jgi:hypothetical protein